MTTFDASRVIPAFDALAQHMRAIELPPLHAFHVAEALFPAFNALFQLCADQHSRTQRDIAVLRRAWSCLASVGSFVPVQAEQESAGSAMLSAMSSLLDAAPDAVDAAAAPHSQFENSEQQLAAHLHKQMQDLTSEYEARSERACIEIETLRLQVAETQAFVSAAPHCPTPSHATFAQCSAGIFAGKNRRNEQFLRELFNRHRDSSGGLRGQNLVQALRDADAPIISTSDQETADMVKQFDANSNGTLDFGEFQAAVSEADELQVWLGEKQLPIVTDALRVLVGRSSDQLKALSQLSPAHIELAAAATCSIIPAMMKELHQELQGAFAIQSQIETDMQADPSKFNDFFKMACGTIADFHKGLTGRVGMPHLNFKHAMRQEHCERAGCDVEFTTGNYKITTNPKREWQYVVDGVACPDMGHQRRLISILELLQRQVCRDAKLCEEEVIAIVLYTGPMFQIYNTILRRYPEDKYSVFRDGDNLFSTTIFVLVSAVQKLSRFTRIPLGTLLYRGLGGKMDLPDIFFQIDDQGCSGYAEWGFLSTTSDRDVALGYSGVKERRRKAMVMVIETSSIDRGADISELSQYPGEKEFLYLPCSFVQRTRQGNGRVQVVDGGLVAFFSVKVNLNIKTQTVEELQEQKKSMHMVSARSMLAEVKYMFSEWTQAMCDQGFDPADVSSVVAENVEACQHIVEIHDQRGVGDYADDELFRAMINEVLDTKARVIRNKNNWQIKLKHMVSARSMVAEAELHVTNWAARYRLQGVDLSQYVGDVSEFRDGLMEMCQRLIAKHEQRDSGDFADVDNLQTLKRELDIVVDATKWQETRMQLRSHEFEAATCVATLEGHSDMAFSVAFHPTAPLLATGSHDKTAKLWRLSSVNSSATCVATLEGHSKNVKSVAFHPTAPRRPPLFPLLCCY